MGCCMSSNSTKDNHKLESDVKCRSPPPPPPPLPVFDEETVKEVLSETSIYRPPAKTASETVAVASNNYRSNAVQRRDIFAEQVREIERIDFIRPTEEAIANVSEISRDCEICSSFSGSCPTTTLNDRDEGEVTQRVILPSPAKTPKKLPYYGEMYNRRLRSPSTSSVASPVTTTSHVRSRPSEERMMVIPWRNVGPINGIQGSPAGRLISPVPCGEAVTSPNVGQKHPSSSITGNPHCLLQARRGGGGGKLGKGNDIIEDTIETIENPHISLECFIFLEKHIDSVEKHHHSQVN